MLIKNDKPTSKLTGVWRMRLNMHNTCHNFILHGWKHTCYSILSVHIHYASQGVIYMSFKKPVRRSFAWLTSLYSCCVVRFFNLTSSHDNKIKYITLLKECLKFVTKYDFYNLHPKNNLVTFLPECIFKSFSVTVCLCVSVQLAVM